MEIFLAKQLRNKEVNQHKEVNQPIFFLTRSEQYSSDSMKNLPLVSGIKHWVPKGYKGGEILNENYLKEYLIEPIKLALEDFRKIGTNNEVKKEGESISGFSGNWFSSQRINEISKATKAALLEKGSLYDRQYRLLFGQGFIDYLATLDTNNNADWQLEFDLKTFNTVERLANGTIPLQIWLGNAIHHLSLHKQADELQKALDEITKLLSVLPTESIYRNKLQS